MTIGGTATTEPQTIIDIYTHVTPAKFKDALFQILPKDSPWVRTISAPAHTVFYDMEARIKNMEEKSGTKGYKQVLTIMQPALETVADPPTVVKLAKLANDGMMKVVGKYPDKFVAAVACLPMDDIDAALKETDRAISEKTSKYNINVAYGWPYESTAVMTRLAVSGILEKYPTLKFIIHHGGGMIPFFQQRIPRTGVNTTGMPNIYAKLTKPIIEYMKMFYADVANIPATAVRLSCEFFGTAHLVFGTDYPFGPPLSQTIAYMGELGIGKEEQKKVFSTNCKTMLNLR